MSVRQKAEVANSAKAVRQDMHQEATDEFIGAERHHLGLVGPSIVFPAEPDPPIVESDQATVGDGYPMGVAAEIVEHLLRAAERSLGVDNPVGPAQRSQMPGERGWLDQRGKVSEKVQCTGIEGGRQPLQEQPAIEPGEHADRQKESRSAGDPTTVRREAAARHDAQCTCG